MERTRLYQRGALAQSYAPRGLEHYLSASWKKMPRRKRRLLIAIYTIDLALVAAGFWAIDTGRTWLILALLGAFVVPGVLIAVLGVPLMVMSERRKQHARRTGRYDSRIPTAESATPPDPQP
jgi:fatty acid desaturase